jgi:hypothetical protein
LASRDGERLRGHDPSGDQMGARSLRTAAAAVVAPLVLSALAACGSGNSAQTAEEPQTSSPTSPSSSPAAPKPHPVAPAAFLTMVKKASGSLTTARFTLNMDISGGQTLWAHGVIDLTGGSPASEMSMDPTGMGTPVDLRTVDGAIYIQVPGLSPRKYVKVDLSQAGQLGGLGAIGTADPRSLLQGITPKMYRHVTLRGVTTSHGQQVRHYRATIVTRHDPTMKYVPPSVAAQVPKSATYDVWIDGQGRIAKFSMLMPKVIRMSGRYSGYGLPVHVTAPPASSLVPLSSLSALSS